MPKPTDRWISTTALATELGVSAYFLREKRTTLFKPKKHYRLKNPTAARPTYVWNLAACKAHLNRATEEAAAIEASQSAALAGRGSQLPLVPGVEAYEIE